MVERVRPVMTLDFLIAVGTLCRNSEGKRNGRRRKGGMIVAGIVVGDCGERWKIVAERESESSRVELDGAKWLPRLYVSGRLTRGPFVVLRSKTVVATFASILFLASIVSALVL